MQQGSTVWARVVRRLQVAGAVMAIVTASVIGLHEWADGAATHDLAGDHAPTAL